MGKRKLENRCIRSLSKNGGGSISVTLPIEEVRKLRWRSKQKVVITRKGSKLTIVDWKK